MRLQSGGMLTGRVLRGALVAASLICAYSIGAGTGGGSAKRSESAVSPDRSVLDQAADQIAAAAAKPVPRAELESAAVKAMLRSLDDPWARHYTAVEYDDVEGRLNGRYSGVGLWLATPDGAAGDDAVRVASVQPASPAERAGVRVGDAIVDVDGRPATGWDVTQVATALRGRPATGVRLTVRRQDGAHRVQERSFQLLRAAAPDRSVRVERPAEGIELIRVAAFTRGVAGEVRDAVTRRAARLDGGINGGGGILLDLRGNPGGLLTEAVDTASTFLASGPVVTYERRDRAAERMDVTRPGDVRTPLVVLVDSGTASAAEIVAGSLRDRDRAVIVGSRTFGKGSVQEPIRLVDGSTIELTVGRYRTPAGRSLDGVGIDPDVAVPADRPPQEAERRALTVLQGLLATLPTNVSPKRGRG